MCRNAPARFASFLEPFTQRRKSQDFYLAVRGFLMKKTKKLTSIIAYFDGCCEPVNPGGTASFGVVILKGKKRIYECSKIFFPQKGKEKETSNNVAEYSGFTEILNYLIENKLTKENIIVYGDSKLVLCQMFGDEERDGMIWKMKGGYYLPFAIKAKELLKKFKNIQGHWIPREENSLADELSKAELLKAGIRFRIQPTD